MIAFGFELIIGTETENGNQIPNQNQRDKLRSDENEREKEEGGDTVNKVASPSQGNGQCGEWKGSQGHRQIALRSVLNTEDREGCAKQPKSVPSSR